MTLSPDLPPQLTEGDGRVFGLASLVFWSPKQGSVRHLAGASHVLCMPAAQKNKQNQDMEQAILPTTVDLKCHLRKLGF